MDGPVGGRTALVLYGTETGTARDLAEDLCQMTERLRFATRIAELNDVSITSLPMYTITVFVVSTTGQGEFPTDARTFWTSLLKKRLLATCLQHVSFFLVGLGDSSYPKFNWAARKLDKRLKQLGASEVIESCEADEQGPESTDGAFVAWLPLFKAALLEHFALTEDVKPVPDEMPLPSKWVLEEVAAISTNGDIDGLYSLAKGNVFEAGKTNTELCISNLDHDCRPIPDSFQVTLDENNRVTPPSHWQDVRFLTLTTKESVDYLPGDAISILPKNVTEDVNTLIHLMNWASIADRLITFVPTSPSYTTNLAMYPPCPIPPLCSQSSRHRRFTLRTLLSDYLDITAIPRRSFFGRLALYTTNSAHKERLLDFTLPQYLDEYYDYATRARRSILEILQEFDSVQIPWWEAANVFPPLRGRSFSIASGGSLRNGTVNLDDGESGRSATSGGNTKFELLVAIVQYRTVIKKIRRGVCTRYLAALCPGSTLNVVLKTDGRFTANRANKANRTCNLDSSSSSDAKLLIGAGTGIAPLRALIKHDEERVLSGAQSAPPITTLFFGARNQNQDFFFANEWAARTTDKYTAAAEDTGAHHPYTTIESTIRSNDHHDQQQRHHHHQHNSNFSSQDLDPSLPSLRLITAFSRDQPKKIYIQDRLLENGAHVFDMLVHRSATVVVCGSSGAMPRAVRAALVDVLVLEGNRRARRSSCKVEEKRNGSGEKIKKREWSGEEMSGIDIRKGDVDFELGDGQSKDEEVVPKSHVHDHDQSHDHKGREQGGSERGENSKEETWTTESANRYLDTMERNMRYLQETW